MAELYYDVCFVVTDRSDLLGRVLKAKTSRVAGFQRPRALDLTSQLIAQSRQ
jgi:hypothetical protein